MHEKGTAAIARKLAELRQEHRDLDQAIKLLSLDPQVNQLQLTRMKKHKLKLKDWIAYIQDQMMPDIYA